MPRRNDDDDDRPRRSRRVDDDDDDDRPRPRRRTLDDLDDDDRRRGKRKPRRVVKQMSPVGLVGLVVGIGALIVSIFMPCLASWSLVPAGIGLVIGFVALFMANGSGGRYGMGMPIAALSVSCVAVLVAAGWLVLGKQIEKKIDKMDKEFQAQADKEEKALAKERAKAADEVKAAGQGGAIKVTAPEFAKAYDKDPHRADLVYKNAVLDVSGFIAMVEVDETDSTYAVTLHAGEDEVVTCEFAKTPENLAKLKTLQAGINVTIRGKCLGGTATIEACVMVE